MDSDLRTETLRLPMARLGDVNPLPPLGPLQQPYRLDTSALPDEMARGIGYGQVGNLMPYAIRDQARAEPDPIPVDFRMH